MLLSAVFVAAVMLAAAQGFAQSAPPPAAKPRPVSHAEADSLVAPIALYPDRLLSQVLIAATYPLEVVEAVRWMNDPANAMLAGQDLVQALDAKDWDPSIKALTAVPQVLRMMDSQLEWTEHLGDAFLADQGEVMTAVQHLRQQARAAGNLVSDGQRRVIDEDGKIMIEPAAPQVAVAYLQLYTPPQTYGVWQYPATPPVYFAPPDYGTPLYQVPLNAPLWDLGLWDWRLGRMRINQPHWRDLDHHHHDGGHDAGHNDAGHNDAGHNDAGHNDAGHNDDWHHDPGRDRSHPRVPNSVPNPGAPTQALAQPTIKPFVDVARDGAHTKAPPLTSSLSVPSIAPHPEIAVHRPMQPAPAFAGLPQPKPALPPTAAAQSVQVAPPPRAAAHAPPAAPPGAAPGAPAGTGTGVHP